ncbi:hypothetical protein MM192_08755 [Aeromonas sp. MR7]|uniref:hypothetical protein n=1 Tax=Aeromonas sp. MR7 TaxID=2923419 RepID=UPI0030DC371F|nr:hypothetical protein [Aeromonas sp. MR7]
MSQIFQIFTRAFNLVLGTINKVAPPQRTGGQMILASILTTRQYGTIELGMLTHPDLKTLLAGKDAGLLYHVLKVTVDLLTASIDLTRGGHAAKSKAAASRDATLLALVVIVILLAGQGQAAVDIGINLVTTDLIAQQ